MIVQLVDANGNVIAGLQGTINGAALTTAVSATGVAAAIDADGNALVSTRGSAKAQITPTMGGINKPSITPAATTYTKNIKLLVTLNTQDDVEAATALTNEYNNVFSIAPNETVEITSPDAPITRVSVIALITGATPGLGTKLAASVEATVAANLRTFLFGSSDNVRLINIGFLDNGTPADTNIFVEGFEYE